MPLPTPQRALLEQYKRFKNTPPTNWQLMLTSAPGIAVLIVFSAAISAFWIALGQEFLLWTIWAFVFGFLLRQFQFVRKSVRLWPIVTKVLDWEKVDALLSADTDQDPFKNR